MPPRSDRSLREAVSPHPRAARAQALIDRRWRALSREAALRNLAARAVRVKWSTRLLRVLLEELHVEEDVARIVGDLRRVPPNRRSSVVVIALAVRHSWRADQLSHLLRRLGIGHKPGGGRKRSKGV
jgi:hypothetical protein